MIQGRIKAVFSEIHRYRAARSLARLQRQQDRRPGNFLKMIQRKSKDKHQHYAQAKKTGWLNRIGTVVVLFILAYVLLQGLGFAGKESLECSSKINSLNSYRIIMESASNKEVNKDFHKALKAANDCALLYTRTTGYKHIVNEERFGDNYELLVYKKWKWLEAYVGK